MKLKPVTIDILLIIVLGVLAFSTFNPYLMPMGMQLTALLAFLILFSAFAVFFWREQGGDEREMQIRHRSDRIAFLAGSIVLLIAIVSQVLSYDMSSPWPVIALSVMVITKVAAHIYNSANH